jgi:DUF971 family protein
LSAWVRPFLVPGFTRPASEASNPMASLTLLQNVVVGDELALAWSDGQENFIKLKALREACPCAACQGEPDAMGRVVKPDVTHGERSFLALRMQLVGGYALQVFWADGHSSGIYPFSLLRGLGQDVD